jgi:hypothetical protein
VADRRCFGYKAFMMRIRAVTVVLGCALGVLTMPRDAVA